MNVARQVEYWRKSSIEDLEAALSLVDKGHLRHGLFFANLAIEKMLKAHVTRCTGDVPPRTHNLVRLCELTNLSPAARDRTFLLEMGVYQLEGRYPDSGPTGLDAAFVHVELDRTREFLEWLKNQL